MALVGRVMDGLPQCDDCVASASSCADAVALPMGLCEEEGGGADVMELIPSSLGSPVVHPPALLLPPQLYDGHCAPEHLCTSVASTPASTMVTRASCQFFIFTRNSTWHLFVPWGFWRIARLCEVPKCSVGCSGVCWEVCPQWHNASQYKAWLRNTSKVTPDVRDGNVCALSQRNESQPSPKLYSFGQTGFISHHHPTFCLVNLIFFPSIKRWIPSAQPSFLQPLFPSRQWGCQQSNRRLNGNSVVKCFFLFLL